MQQECRQDALRIMGSLASGWRQVASGCVKMVSGNCLDSIRMAWGSVRVASEWRQDIMLVRGWRRDSVRLASGQPQHSVKIASGWRYQDLVASQGVNQASRLDTHQK